MDLLLQRSNEELVPSWLWIRPAHPSGRILLWQDRPRLKSRRLAFATNPKTEALAYCCQLLRSWSLRASFGKRVRKHGARFRMIFVTKNWQKIAVVLPLFVLPNSSVQFKEVCSCVLPRARGCRISENQSINKRRNAKARTHVDKCGGCEERSKSISDCRRSGLKSPC